MNKLTDRQKYREYRYVSDVFSYTYIHNFDYFSENKTIWNQLVTGFDCNSVKDTYVSELIIYSIWLYTVWWKRLW